jgi:hypothetical protein
MSLRMLRRLEKLEAAKVRLRVYWVDADTGVWTLISG